MNTTQPKRGRPPLQEGERASAEIRKKSFTNNITDKMTTDTTIQIQPKRAPIQRKTTAFPLLDGISEAKANRLLFALRKGGFAAYLQIWPQETILVTEASLEQLCACAGPALGFLK